MIMAFVLKGEAGRGGKIEKSRDGEVEKRKREERMIKMDERDEKKKQNKII